MAGKAVAWSYEASVERATRLYTRWKDVTSEFLAEIYDAKQHIEASPHTWEDYCREIGVSRQTLLNWLNRFDPKTKSILPPSPEPEEDEPEVFTEDDEEEEKPPEPKKPEPEKPKAKPEAKQNSSLDYWSMFGPLKANCETVAKKMQSSMDNQTPLSLAYAVGHIQEFAQFLESWQPEKMKTCQHCQGEGCEYCFNGKSGEYRT